MLIHKLLFWEHCKGLQCLLGLAHCSSLHHCFATSHCYITLLITVPSAHHPYSSSSSILSLLNVPFILTPSFICKFAQCLHEQKVIVLVLFILWNCFYLYELHVIILTSRKHKNSPCNSSQCLLEHCPPASTDIILMCHILASLWYCIIITFEFSSTY